MTRKQAELLLASVIVARSTSYLFSKTGLESMGMFNMVAVRFIIAFLLLGVIFFKKLIHINKRDIFAGAVLGAIFIGITVFELTGLKTTDTSTVSFLENTAIVFVPLIEAQLLRRLPKAANMLGALLALCGVGLLTLRQGAFGFTAGECCCLGAALLYAVGIIATDRLSHKGDGLMIGVAQVFFMGVYALALSLIFEQPRLPETGTEWGCVLALAIVCTSFGYTLQPVAQAHTTSQTAGLMCGLNPAFASVLGVAILGEPVTLQGVCGAALILISLFIPHLAERLPKRAGAAHAGAAK